MKNLGIYNFPWSSQDKKFCIVILHFNFYIFHFPKYSLKAS